VIDYGEFRVYVDLPSYFFLNGTELDYTDELMGKRFQFNNPNVDKACKCGQSVSFVNAPKRKKARETEQTCE
jgi:iron-sulfur cluster assembly protein